jgi:hypothetical protein
MCRTRRRRGGRPSFPSGRRARWPRRWRRAGGGRGEGEWRRRRRTCRGRGGAGWRRCVSEAAVHRGGDDVAAATATARGGWRGGAEPERRVAPCRPPPHPKQNPFCWGAPCRALVLPAGRPFRLSSYPYCIFLPFFLCRYDYGADSLLLLLKKDRESPGSFFSIGSRVAQAVKESRAARLQLPHKDHGKTNANDGDTLTLL